MGFHSLVDHTHKLVILWNLGVGHTHLFRLIHEAVTGQTLSNVYSLLDPMHPDDHVYHEDLETVKGLKDYAIIGIIRDPWSRLTAIYEEFVLRLKAHAMLDIKYKFVNGVNFPFQDVVKLGALLQREVLAPIVEAQVAEEYPEGTRFVTLDKCYKPLKDALEGGGASTSSLASLEALTSRALKSTSKSLSRIFIGHVPPTNLALAHLPPYRAFYSNELWDIVSESYGADLAKWPELNQTFSKGSEPKEVL